MFKEPPELPPEDEKPIGEVLHDLDKVLGPLPETEAERSKEAKKRDLKHEVSALRTEAEDVLDLLRTGQQDPGLVDRANQIRRELHEAQADEIANSGLYPTDQADR